MTTVLYDKLHKAFDDKELEILFELRSNGYEAYFVGGAVRDVILELQTNDVDITTSATPEEIKEVFSKFKTIDFGIEHGTVVVLYKGEDIEITTFRTDGEYTDKRRPDSVSFTRNVEDDLHRRDFTINSLAYNPKVGLVDLEGGVNDINKKIIRCVGLPRDRFSEDPLRILRGLRFASKLGFEIDKETKDAMIKFKDLLNTVSSERVRKELIGVLMGKNAKEVLTEFSSVIAVIIPEIKPMIGFEQKNRYHIHDVWTHSIHVVKYAKEEEAHKVTALLHDIGKPACFVDKEDGTRSFIGHEVKSAEIAQDILVRLRFPNKVRNKIIELVSEHNRSFSTKKYKVARDIYRLGAEMFFEHLEFQNADDLGKNPDLITDKLEDTKRIKKIAEEYLENDPILSHKDLSINPQDIIDLGFRGKDVGVILNRLVLLALSGHKNEKESQIESVKKMK